MREFVVSGKVTQDCNANTLEVRIKLATHIAILARSKLTREFLRESLPKGSFSLKRDVLTVFSFCTEEITVMVSSVVQRLGRTIWRIS